MLAWVVKLNRVFCNVSGPMKRMMLPAHSLEHKNFERAMTACCPIAVSAIVKMCCLFLVDEGCMQNAGEGYWEHCTHIGIPVLEKKLGAIVGLPL